MPIQLSFDALLADTPATCVIADRAYDAGERLIGPLQTNKAEEAVSRLSGDIAQGMRESSGVVTNMARQVDALEEMVAAFRDNCVGENC